MRCRVRRRSCSRTPATRSTSKRLTSWRRRPSTSSAPTAPSNRGDPVLLTYFTEQPMSAYPEQATRVITSEDHPARHAGDSIVLFSNKHFDRTDAARLYAERMVEYRA